MVEQKSMYGAVSCTMEFWIKIIMNILQNLVLLYDTQNTSKTSKTAKNCFQSNKIQVIDRPVQSPELNRMEDLWTDINKGVFKKKLITTTELWEVVRLAWYAIPSERLAQLVDSTQYNCPAVIENKGYCTKYFYCKSHFLIVSFANFQIFFKNNLMTFFF